MTTTTNKLSWNDFQTIFRGTGISKPDLSSLRKQYNEGKITNKDLETPEKLMKTFQPRKRSFPRVSFKAPAGKSVVRKSPSRSRIRKRSPNTRGLFIPPTVPRKAPSPRARSVSPRKVISRKIERGVFRTDISEKLIKNLTIQEILTQCNYDTELNQQICGDKELWSRKLLDEFGVYFAGKGPLTPFQIYINLKKPSLRRKRVHLDGGSVVGWVLNY